MKWTAQRQLTLALIISLLFVLLAVALVADDRRRHLLAATSAGAVPDAGHTAAPSWTWAPARLSLGRAMLAAGLWVVLSVLLIGFSWAVWGLVAGAVVLGTRRARLAELTAVSCLIAIACLVVFVERRDAPFPGGGWPISFNSVHGIGLFAVVAILVGALVADDGEP